MTDTRRIERRSLTDLIRRVDGLPPDAPAEDTVPTGFPSLDKLLGGGLRRRDLIVLGGDVGAGKSALALAVALRTAMAGYPVVFFSGEMDEDRLMERAVAIEGRTPLDTLRTAGLSEEARSAVGAAAVRLRDLPLAIYPMTARQFDDVLHPAWAHDPALVIVDYVQLLPPARDRPTQEEDTAAATRALKAMALARQVACLAVAQLPALDPTRADPRPTLADYATLGSIKQHADLVLSIYREEMYHPGGGVEGGTELIVSKNRNGPTGFVDLYFYEQWMRFEDMLDPAG